MTNKVIVALCIVMCMTLTVFADIFYDINLETDEITISGVLPSTAVYRRMGILLLNPDINPADADLESMSAQTAVNYFNEFNAADNGSFSHTFTVAPQSYTSSAEYKLYINYFEAEAPEFITFVYYSNASKKEIIEKFINANSAKEISALLKASDNMIVLGLNKEPFSLGNADFIGSLLFEKKSLLTDNVTDFLSHVFQSIVISLANDKTKTSQLIDVLDMKNGDYIKLFNESGIDKDSGYYLLYNKCTTEVKKAVAEFVNDSGCNNADELSKDFELSVLKGILKKSAHYLTTREAITVYKDKFSDICYNKYYNLIGDKKIAAENALAAKAVTVQWDSYADIEAALEECIHTDNGGGAGSPNRGTGIGGGSSFNISLDAAQANQTKDGIISFSDIDDVLWAKEGIDWLAEKKIIQGDGMGMFCPNKSITREEFVKMLVGTFGWYNSEAKSQFSDVSENEWYYTYISSAYEKNIVLGKGDSTFGVSDFITREDMAVMICRALEAAGISYEETDGEEFLDNDEIADYAKEYVHLLYGMNIINGTGGDLFSPKGQATRAEVAKILFNCRRESI